MLVCGLISDATRATTLRYMLSPIVVGQELAAFVCAFLSRAPEDRFFTVAIKCLVLRGSFGAKYAAQVRDFKGTLGY